MAKRLGKAFIKVNGNLLETMPGATIDIGGVERKPVIGDHAHLGPVETVKPSMIECEIAVGPGTSLADLGKIVDAVVTFECDTGQVYSVGNAYNTETPKATAGDGGKVPVKLAGDPAQEMVS